MLESDYPESSSSDHHPVRPRLGLQPGPHQAFGHGVELVATVEAPGETGEVALRMLLADVVVGAGERRFDVAERRVDPVERRPLRRLFPAAGGHREVIAARLRHDLPTRQAVADDIGAGSEARLGELGDLGLAKALDDLQPQAFRLAIEGGLDHGNKRRLRGSTAATFAARANAAEIGVVELDPAAHLRLAGIALFHCNHQLLLHQPSCRLAHTQSSRQLDRTDPSLGLRHLVDRPKPRGQRQLRAVEDRAGGEPRLVLAGVALDMLAALHPRILLATTPFAGEAAPPAHLEQHRQALLLRPEPRAKRRLAQPPHLGRQFHAHPRLPSTAIARNSYHITR